MGITKEQANAEMLMCAEGLIRDGHSVKKILAWIKKDYGVKRLTELTFRQRLAFVSQARNMLKVVG